MLKAKKILTVTEGNWLSHVSRSLTIAKALQKTGHEVEFACSGKYTSLIEKSGFSITPIFTKDPDRGLNKARTSGSSYDGSMVEKYVASEIECIKDASPDLIIGDFRITLSISAEYCKIPYVSILNGYWTNYYNARHTAPESMNVVKLLGRTLSDAAFPFIKKSFIKLAARPFNREREKRGLIKCNNLFDIMASRDLNLITDIPEFTPLKNQPANFKFVGPILWEPDTPVPDWAASIKRNNPVIYVTMGSTGFNKYFQDILHSYSGTDYQVMITTGDESTLDNVPANFFIERFAPGMKLMEMSDVVICHGGNGTIYQALSRGVPIVGIPTMHDQWFNMERVEALGAGIKIRESGFDARHISSAVTKILSDHSYKENALELQKIIQNYNAADTSVEIINSFIENKFPGNQ